MSASQATLNLTQTDGKGGSAMGAGGMGNFSLGGCAVLGSSPPFSALSAGMQMTGQGQSGGQYVQQSPLLQGVGVGVLSVLPHHPQSMSQQLSPQLAQQQQGQHGSPFQLGGRGMGSLGLRNNRSSPDLQQVRTEELNRNFKQKN
jgi:hypothetical protein